MKKTKEYRSHFITAVVSISVTLVVAISTGASKSIGQYLSKPNKNEVRSKKNKVRHDSLCAVFSQHKHIEYAPLVKVQEIEDNSIAVAVISSKVKSVDKKMDLLLDHMLDLQKTIRYSQASDSLDSNICNVKLSDTLKDAVVILIK